MTYYLYLQPEDVNQLIQPSDFFYSTENLEELQRFHIESNPDTNALILRCEDYPQEGVIYPFADTWMYSPSCQWYQDIE